MPRSHKCVYLCKDCGTSGRPATIDRLEIALNSARVALLNRAKDPTKESAERMALAALADMDDAMGVGTDAPQT